MKVNKVIEITHNVDFLTTVHLTIVHSEHF